jgi:hypothetical protein
MDDARIEQIRREVMSQLGETASERATHDLESRVSALEAAVAELRGAAPASSSAGRARALNQPALHVRGSTYGSQRCVMEPDKPCVQSHACRTFGH